MAAVAVDNDWYENTSADQHRALNDNLILVWSRTDRTKERAAQGRKLGQVDSQLKLFSEVLERIKSQYVEKPDDRKLVVAAIQAVIKKFPSTSYNIPDAVEPGSATYDDLSSFSEVFRVAAKEYGNPSNVVGAAINAMLNELDAQSTYVDANSFREGPAQTGVPFGGLGIEVTMEQGLVKVVAALDETPAARAGIAAGDIITHVDEKQIQSLTLTQAVERLRGPVNTKAKLKIMRPGHDKPIEVTITRETILVHPVRARPEGDVGYIRISQFNDQTEEGLKKAISDLSAQIPAEKLKGYVIDLRNNPGGLLSQAIEVADTFLERGEIVSTRGRIADETQHFNARPGDMANGKPLSVLINGGTASASEIVAGALQAHKRATIVGTRSFGKGSVQTIIPLDSGNGALRLTTAYYITPAGHPIQAKGITPDVEVLQDAAKATKSRTDSQKSASGGSQSYVPQDPKDDKALSAAINLIRSKGKKKL